MFIQITFCFALSSKSPPKYYHLHHIDTFHLTFSKRFDIKSVFPVIWFSFPLMLHSASERGDSFLISDLKRNILQKCKENSDSLDLIYHIKFKYQNKNKYKKWEKNRKLENEYQQKPSQIILTTDVTSLLYSYTLARPKSAIFTCLSLVINIFWGLMSRWTNLLTCRWSIPENNWYIKS